MNVPQVEEGHYKSGYEDEGRWHSYWQQIDSIRQQQPSSILEVGVGNGIVSDFLKRQGYKITTLDHDAHLKPDIVGSVLDLPCGNGSYDLLSVCQVLEHLPYQDFGKALREIRRVTARMAIISLPDCGRMARIDFTFPKVKRVRMLASLPRLRKKMHQFDGQHYWEIGKKGFALHRIAKDIEAAGFRIRRSYRVFENPYHRFFILEKT